MRIEDEIARAADQDHARAGERGDRLRTIANALVSALIGQGLLHGDARVARVLAFHTLADHLYGNRAIDIPTELGKP
jgi:hypothetical protein